MNKIQKELLGIAINSINQLKESMVEEKFEPDRKTLTMVSGYLMLLTNNDYDSFFNFTGLNQEDYLGDLINEEDLEI
jgi:hypothetical protein